MSDDDLGLSEREKELKKWNQPYRFQPYPKMLFRGRLVGGRTEVEQRIVASEGEEGLAEIAGWRPHPTLAIAEEDARQEAPGIAAAERAYRDLRLSQAAQAEAAVVEASSSGHLGEIPVAKKRPRGRPFTKKATPVAE